MKKENFWLGVLVILLVFGMAVAGCGDDTDDTKQEKKDNTIYSVSILNGNDPKVGSVLTTSVENEDGYSVSGVTYQWKRADSQSGTFANISNATSSSYTLTSEDSGKYIKVEAKNSDTPAPVLSAAVGPVDANQVAKPTANPDGGSFISGQEIMLASTTTGAIIYYTLDGTTPTSSSNSYNSATKPKITSSCTLKAIATKTDMVDSEVLSVSYTVVAAPSFTAVTSTSSGFTSSGIYSVAYGNNRYVAGGSGRIAYSTNGTTWTESTGTSSSWIVHGITYGTQFVAVGSSGIINYSSDGASWSNVTSTTFTSYINDVAYGGGTYVAVGDSGKIAYSTNGTTWTAVTDSTFGTSNIKGITYGAGKFIAVGADGKMAYSANGTTWTAVASSTFTSTIYGITCGGESGKEKFVAVGVRSMDYQTAYSADGVTWTYGSSFTGGGLIGSLNRVAWGGNKFVAVASQGVMYYSLDGIRWGKIEGGTGTGKSQFDSAGSFSSIRDVVYGG